MNITDHCKLCGNQVVDFQQGTLCGLTNKRPDFNSSCRNISFSEKMENEILGINLEFEKTKTYKTSAITYLIALLIASCGTMLASYLLATFIWDKGFISTVPLIIFGAGFILFPFSFAPYNGYRKKMAVATEKKKTLDDVLNRYNIDYNINMQFGKEIHEEQTVDIELEIHKKGKSHKINKSILLNNATNKIRVR